MQGPIKSSRLPIALFARGIARITRSFQLCLSWQWHLGRVCGGDLVVLGFLDRFPAGAAFLGNSSFASDPGFSALREQSFINRRLVGELLQRLFASLLGQSGALLKSWFFV